MSSSNPPFRQPNKQDPVDAMLDEWKLIKAGERRDKPPEHQPGGVWPPLAQLELMILLLKRP
jgi:hypothetical protein